MKKLLWISAALAAAACAKKAETDGDKEIASVTATVETAKSSRFVETVEAVGLVASRAGHVASLAAPSPTRVSKIFVAAGNAVKAGDPLIEFEQAAFDAAAKSADAALAAAERAAERAQRLADAGVSPRKDAEAAAADLAAARSNAVVAHRARELSTLRSPIAGVVTRMSAVLGASVDAGQPLVEVADPGDLDVILTLSPDDAARVHAGSAVSLFESAAATDSAIAHGSVLAVGAVLDSTNRGVAARVAVYSSKRTLRIGESVFGRVTVQEHASVVTLPGDALVPSGEGFHVFVVDDKGIAHSRDVVIGGRTDAGVYIKSGVAAGEKVVTKGAYGMDDSVKVATGKP